MAGMTVVKQWKWLVLRESELTARIDELLAVTATTAHPIAYVSSGHDYAQVHRLSRPTETMREARSVPTACGRRLKLGPGSSGWHTYDEDRGYFCNNCRNACTGNLAAFVGTFNRADMTDSPYGFECLCAWYALEAVGRRLGDRQYDRHA